jgi:hypothetical protein
MDEPTLPENGEGVGTKTGPSLTVETTETPGGTTEPEAEQASIPSPIPAPQPLPLKPLPFLMTSGLYRSTQRSLPMPQPVPLAPGRGFEDIGDAEANGHGEVEDEELVATLAQPLVPLPIRRIIADNLRLDVDGRYPQMTASGEIRSWLTGQVHWIANLVRTGPNTYQGRIFYKNGDVNLLPHTTVRITASRSSFPERQRATVVFSGGAATMTRTYAYVSRSFRPVELEFDCVQGTVAATSVDTHHHPNRPASLPKETLTLERVFERAGFDVSKAGGDSIVPLAAAGANQTWSNQEMHDAMQVHWSRFANKPQWSFWTLFAGRHDMGTSLGGIMFDSIGPNHRQGTAIFIDSFISQAPAGETNPAAWIRRMRFWTAVHEMGHAFNLAHSWQKSLGTPWIPLTNEPEARSFMNYPYFVAGGQQAFFADFAYRFSDAELLFMRHAPERFVQMGNANWFDNHGFEQAAEQIGNALTLEVRLHRDRPHLAFLEPLNIELKLRNSGTAPVIVDAARLHSLDSVTVISKRERDPARLFLPFARYCLEPQPTVLQPGESLYAALEPSAGIEGWDVSEPGRYLVQVALHLGDVDLISNELQVRVAPPRGYDEEFVAQDYFTEDVGRILAFDGSRVLKEGNDALVEVRERCPDNPAALHAAYALAAPMLRAGKELTIPEGAAGRTLGETGAEFREVAADETEARRLLDEALVADVDASADAFGHIPFKEHVDEYAKALAEAGDTQHAAHVQEQLHTCLEARQVLPRVLEEIASHVDELERGTVPQDWRDDTEGE